jgi:hypothetical protein
MNGYSGADEEDIFRKENFDVNTLEDEIRIDSLCQRLLRLFYIDLAEEGRQPAEAGHLAWGADYFLREFLIPDRRENIFAPRPGRVRQFAGNWYIIKNLEPNMEELGNILQGIGAFYEYGRKIGKVGEEVVEDVRRDCAELDFYRRRIDSFWEIEGDGYSTWEQECSLKNQDKGQR